MRITFEKEEQKKPRHPHHVDFIDFIDESSFGESQKDEFPEQKPDYTHEELVRHRWFNNQGDALSWEGTKSIITTAICLVLAGGMYLIVYRMSELMICGLAAGIGTLVGTLLLTHRSIQGFLKGHSRHTPVIPVTGHQEKCYFLENQDNILFIEEGSALTAIGLYQILKPPLNITANAHGFAKMLHQANTPLLWLYAQSQIEAPLYDLRARMEEVKEVGPWVVQIYIGTLKTVSARSNIKSKRVELASNISKYLTTIHTALIETFRHTPIEALRGQGLLAALNVIKSGGGIPALGR